MAKTVILTVEDDAAIRRGIVDSLEYTGHQVLQAGDGISGLEMALKSEYDLLLLDLALPGVSGLEILKKLKKVRPTQPVIILTAKGDEQDRVQGLRDGADDYVVKPFSIKELLARVEAVLRRSPERPRDVRSVSFLGGVVDFERREVRFRSQKSTEGETAATRAELSEKETELIQYLVANSGRAISREELLSSVWRLSPKGITTRTIDMHIARLREKMRENKAAAATILTVRGKGYMWSVCGNGAN
ncbi:MAG: response regulator transcription factor [Mariniblastus sp.]|nr:response regulator transcription factor [Mariniblastus sp.]MDG2180461.1 response regulator transcription factor [Mariniblastus sp.]